MLIIVVNLGLNPSGAAHSISCAGTLDVSELTKLFGVLYKDTGVSRSSKRVNREVNEALREFDTDGDGVINFPECITLIAKSPEFKFDYPVRLVTVVSAVPA
jgi:hypothetical protein